MKIIHETTDYDGFKNLPGQRLVVESHVNEIIRSIEMYGWICDPIRVTENMEVFDGQHRLEALRRLQLPVEYIVLEGLTTADAVRIINNTQRKWAIKDYTYSFANTKSESYMLIKDLADRYSVSENVVLRAANKGSVSGANKQNGNYKTGNISFTQQDYSTADSKLPLFKKYSDLFSSHKGHKRAKDVAFFFLIENGYEYDMIAAAEQKYGDKKENFYNGKVIIEYIERICNFKKSKANRIFMLDSFNKHLDTRGAYGI